jgi:hypothetical protein
MPAKLNPSDKKNSGIQITLIGKTGPLNHFSPVQFDDLTFFSLPFTPSLFTDFTILPLTCR